MATTKELMINIDKYADLDIGNLTIRIKITDAKQAYGHTRYRIVPINGSGAIWVAHFKLTNIRNIQ